MSTAHGGALLFVGEIVHSRALIVAYMDFCLNRDAVLVLHQFGPASVAAVGVLLTVGVSITNAAQITKQLSTKRRLAA